MSEKKPVAKKTTPKEVEPVDPSPFTEIGGGVSALPVNGGCVICVKGEGLVFAPRTKIATRPNGEIVLI